MINYNKAVVVGNITRNPEIKALESGHKVTNFSVATNRVWNDQNGQRQEQAEFHNIVVFGKLAETAANWLTRGQSVLVEGRLQTRSWESDGVRKYRTEIVASSIQFGSRPKGNDNGGSTVHPVPYPKDPKPTDAAEEKPDPTTLPIEYPKEKINSEEIPF